MKVTQEMNWYDVMSSAWGGAQVTAENLECEGKGEEFIQYIEECYPEGIDRTTLNDIMAFEEECYRAVGMKSPYDDWDDDKEDWKEDDE